MQDTMNGADRETALQLQRLGRAFRIPGPFFGYEEIKMGNVNRTYKVSYVMEGDSGTAHLKHYLVQRINTYAFRSPEELMANIEKVTGHLRQKAPDEVYLHFHHTADRKNYVADESGFWRLCNYIPSVTFNTCSDPRVVRNAGKAFGHFQTMLSDFDPVSLYFTIPDFHNTRVRYEKLEADVKADPLDRVKDAGETLEWLMSVRDRACLLTDRYLKGELPLRVTHNDTKINNVLFEKETFRPLTVIDLDTVMPGLVGHDFGDAIRFAANTVEEDCRDFEKASLDLNVFWAFAQGFLSETASSLTGAEVDTLAESCFGITCELATRFLDDYILGDRYFKTAYPGHNLVRARCQAALANDMLRKMDAMDALVKRYARMYGAGGGE